MTEDEMNRKMEFLIEWQAQFAADIEHLKERQDRFDRQLETLTSVANSAIDTSTRTAEVVVKLIEAQDKAQTEARAQYRKTQLQIGKTQRQIARVARLLEAHIRKGHPPDASAG